MRWCPQNRGSPTSCLVALMSFAAARAAVGAQGLRCREPVRASPRSRDVPHTNHGDAGGKALCLTVGLNGAAIRGKQENWCFADLMNILSVFKKKNQIFKTICCL